MASLDHANGALQALRGRVEKSRTLVNSCKKILPEEFNLLSDDLNALFHTVVDLSAVIYSSEYRYRTDVDHITTEIEGIAIDSLADVRALDATLPSWASSRSVRSSESLVIKDLGERFYKHSQNFQRALDRIKGRADWSKLSLSVPEASSKAKGLSPKTKNVSFDSSASACSEGRSAPPSPYQATVEEVEDSGDIEDEHSHEHYHVDPPLFPQASNSGAGAPKMTPPPRVVLRSPTDPNTLEQNMQSLDFDDDEPLVVTKDSAASDFSAGAWNNAFNAQPLNTKLESSTQSLTTSSRKQSKEGMEAELRRLTAEIERLKASGSASSTPSRHSPSRSIDGSSQSTQFMRPPQSSRPRASTTTATDSRPTGKFGSYSSANSPRSPRPHVSPRFSPVTPPEQTPRYKQSRTEDRRPKATQRESTYGADPNKPLPTVLEGGLRPTPQRPSMGADYRKRASFAAEDFSHFTLPDPPLFGNSGEPSTRPTPSRTNTDKEDLPPGVTQKRLPITLEDMYYGANKKVRFKRRVPDEIGVKLIEDTRILTVAIYPGLKPGSLLKHPNEGDYNHATGRLGEVWFALYEQEHRDFERRGQNLHMTLEIPLADALCGWNRTVTSICNKEVKVKHAGPTASGWKDCFAGLGLPKYDKDNPSKGGERGDMFVEVKVKMPTRLDERQKRLIQSALGNGSPGRY